MAILTHKDIEKLARHETQHAISIFLPTHRGGPEAQEDVIRFKNRLSEAEKRLCATGTSQSEVRTHIDAANALLEARGFWRRQSDGLAVFLAPEIFRTYRLPTSLEELTVVGRTFQITPLLSAVDTGSEFYILPISQQHVRLLHGSRDSIGEIALPGAPDGVDEMFLDEDTSDQLQFRTIAGASGGLQDALFHGQEGNERSRRERTLHYFRRVDEEVKRALRGKSAPLVFAGDVSLFSLYKEANTYSQLCEQFVHGNPDALSRQQLHEQAWPIVRERLDTARKEIIASVNKALGLGQGTCDIASLVRNAEQGRIETLLLAAGAHRWGRIQSDAGQIQVLPERENGSQDLLNAAARYTLLRGGRVLTVRTDEMPTEDPAAAAFRFEYKE